MDEGHDDLVDPTIRMLRSVLAVAHALHFGEAASQLQVPRSSLSDQVAAFEKMIGAPVFERHGGSVTLTALGHEVVELARPVVEAHDRLCLWLDDEPTEQHEVRLGFLAGLDQTRLTAVLRRVAEVLPSWRLLLSELGFTEAEAALREGRIDVALSVEPVDLGVTDLRGTEVWREPRVLMVERRHRLAGRDHVTLADLRDEALLVPAGGRSAAARAWVQDPREDGTPVRYGPPTRSIHEAVQLVAAGLGVNLTARSVQQQISHPDVAFVPVLDAPEASLWVMARAGERSPGVAAVESAARSSGYASLLPAAVSASQPDAVAGLVREAGLGDWAQPGELRLPDLG